MKKLLSKQTEIQKNKALLNHSSDLAKLTDDQAENFCGGSAVFLLIIAELTAPGGQIETQGALRSHLGLGGG